MARLAWSFLIGCIIGAAALYLYLQESGRLTLAQAHPSPVSSPRADSEASPGTPVGSAPRAVPAVLASAEGNGSLAIPVVGIGPDALLDSFADARGRRSHGAIDIMAPRGTPVIAADDGTVVKLFDSRAGGLTIYQMIPDRAMIFYYAHLDRYSEGLAEGRTVQQGEVIGYVGSSGNANPAAPHLHFSMLKAAPGGEWWKGTEVDPYPLLREKGKKWEIRGSR